MSWFDDAPSVPTKPVPEKIERVIDTTTVYKPESTQIVTLLEGTPWTVTLYEQLLADDDQPRRLEARLEQSVQQYKRIDNARVNVTSDLSFSTERETNISELSGSGNLYPEYTPNVGNHFVGRLQDGRMGFFVITGYTRITYHTKSAWTIEYDFMEYMTDTLQRQLDMKTVEHVVWDSRDAGSNTAFTQYSVVQQTVSACDMMRQLVGWLWDEYYDHLTQTLLVPAERATERVYDPMLVDFITKMVGHELRGRHPRLTQYHAPTGHNRRLHRTVWDTLLDGRPLQNRRDSRYVSLVSAKQFKSNRIYRSVATATIDVVYTPFTEQTLHSSTPVGEKRLYGFTDAFYDDDSEGMSRLELEVTSAIRGEPVSVERIWQIIDDLQQQTPHARLYQLPVLIWLLLTVTGGKR